MKLPQILPLLALASVAPAADHQASSPRDLAHAAGAAEPGDTIILSGDPFSGVHLSGLTGTADNPITLRGASAENPAEFLGGRTGLHLSRCRHVTLRHLVVRQCSLNGINIDDGGDKKNPATGITVEDCIVRDIGPRGNHDGLKMSGVDHFTVRRCRFSGWGGSAIDMVGCHDGSVEDCRFVGKDAFSQSNAVQMKGGSARIKVLHNRFLDAGQRAINIGGSTGLDYFRPAVGPFEATDIEVAGNRFSGSLSPVAWVNSTGGHVHHNTIVHPEKWVARILQENTGPGFEPSQRGVFEHNLVIFDNRVRVPVNVGGNTAPDTFTFRNNAWFNSAGGRHKPSLPVPETGGVYGIDPGSVNVAKNLQRKNTDPALTDMGAAAFPKTSK